MVGRNFTMVFEFTDEEYAAYERWCEETGQKGAYTGAIGGSQTFHYVPTSIGEIVYVTCNKVIRDEDGNISYDASGKPRTKEIRHDIRDLV